MESKTPAFLAASVFETARRRPDADAVIFPAGRWTYGDLAAAAGARAADLAARGVRPGDRVVLAAAGGSADFVAAYLACHRLGAIAVPIAPETGAAALAAIVASTEPKAVLREYGAVPAAAAAPAFAADPDSVADILFTGATTGASKGVMQTHANIAAFARSRNAAVGCAPGDRLALPLPLSHGFGLGRLRAALLAGAAVILVDGFADCDALLAAIGARDATSLCCVPAGFAVLFARTGDRLGEHAGKLRYLETATAPLPDAQRDRLRRLLPRARLFNTYGQTETTSTIAFVDLNSPDAPAGSVGKPAAGVELRVDEGRILIRGAGVMKGYWRDPARTAEVLRGGWYESSDLGFLDAGGHLHLRGRRDDAINVGGLKVYPAEVENALQDHPAVSDCACAAAEDPAGMTGETVRAFLVAVPGGARPEAEELVAFLRGKLESWKIPSSFEWVASLPRTAAGKIRRGSLNEEADAEAVARVLTAAKEIEA